MTLAEFGKFVKSKLWIQSAPDELVAEKFLMEYPQYKKYITAGPEKIDRLTAKPIGFMAGIMAERESKIEASRASIAASISNQVIYREASRFGVDVPTLMQMKLNQQHHDLSVKLMQEEYEHTKRSHELKQVWSAVDASHKRNPVSSRSRSPEREILSENLDGIREPDAPSVARDEDGSPEVTGVRRRKRRNPNR